VRVRAGTPARPSHAPGARGAPGFCLLLALGRIGEARVPAIPASASRTANG
jgi:hypothetical protein